MTVILWSALLVMWLIYSQTMVWLDSPCLNKICLSFIQLSADFLSPCFIKLQSCLHNYHFFWSLFSLKKKFEIRWVKEIWVAKKCKKLWVRARNLRQEVIAVLNVECALFSLLFCLFIFFTLFLGSGPEGVDDLCFHTYGEFSPSSPSPPSSYPPPPSLQAHISAWRLGCAA